MSSSNYLLNLIVRMSVDGIPSPLGDTHSHERIKLAYEEARNVNDPRFLEELVLYITNETDDGKKRHFYFIFSNLIKNTKNLNYLQLLIDRLLVEKKVEILVTILSILGEIFKPLSIDITPILSCTNNKSWQVRGKAYLALTNTGHRIEKFLSEKLQSIFNNDDQLYLLLALRYVGKDLSIPIVESFVKNRKPSIRNAASYTLAIILLRKEYTIDKISEKTKISIEGLGALNNKILEFTRPG